MNAPEPPAATTPVLAFDEFELRTDEMRLRRAGELLPLAGRPVEVLAALAQRSGRLVGKDELLDAVWGHRHVSESVLKVAINALRSALQDDARQPRYVETVPRRGYRFVAALRAAAAPVPPPPQPELAIIAPPGNLPPPGAPLVGRESALVTLREAMGQARLVTLTGLGGVGKTRLALAAAPLDAPPDGVWLLHLDDLDDPALVAPTVAHTLRLAPEAGADAAVLARTLAPLRLRLVLDNAEHLVEAVAALVAALLRAAPQVQLLVTSQLPLRVAGEQVLPLAPLDLPADFSDEAPDPDGYAAARLLCARLRQQQAGWQPAAGDAEHIAALCRALDGVPLALELAAARVPLLGLAGVRRRLDERFALLTRAPRDAAARHRSLAAALDWTCSLLSEPERRALQQLAVFVGSFSAESAEVVIDAADGDPLALVDSLHERSLLATEPGADGTRLRLFDSVRRHALAQLGDTGAASEHAARARHLRWTLTHFEAADEAEFWTPLARWLPPLHADLDNLRAALQFGLRTAAHDDAARTEGRRLLAAAMGYLCRSGHRREAQAWLDVALALPPADDGTARLLDHAQGLLAQHGVAADVAAGCAAAQRALPWLRAQGRRRQAYLNLYSQCMLQLRLGAGAAAAPLLEQMRALVEPHWTELQRRSLSLQEAAAARDAGDVAGYFERCRRSAQALRALGATIECWPMDVGCAQALALQGRLDEACALLGQALEEVRAAGALRQHLHLVAMNAALRLWRGGPGMAAVAREALRLLQVEDRVWWVADALAWAAWHGGRANDALRLRAWADAHLQRRGERRGPMFARLHADLGAHLAGLAPAAPDLLALDDAAAIELALRED